MSEVMGCLKGKSSLMNFDRYANLKYKHGNRHSWCRGYYVDTVGTESVARECSRGPDPSERIYDPFTGEPASKGKERAAPGRGQPVIVLRLADFFMRLEARLSYALIGLVQATGYAGG